MSKKLFLDSTDLQMITKFSIGHCRRILRKIRQNSRKQKHQKVTIPEIAEYLGLNEDEIRNALK